jgi:hypothetical protein
MARRELSSGTESRDEDFHQLSDENTTGHMMVGKVIVPKESTHIEAAIGTFR